MTDMGAMRWCLGIEVIRDRVAGWIKLSQAKYFRDVLTGYGLVPGACRSPQVLASGQRLRQAACAFSAKATRVHTDHLSSTRAAAKTQQPK